MCCMFFDREQTGFGRVFETKPDATHVKLAILLQAKPLWSRARDQNDQMQHNLVQHLNSVKI